MSILRHKIQLSQRLFENLLEQKNKSIMINTKKCFGEGDLVLVEENVSDTGLLTGRSNEYLILQVRILKMSAFKNLQIIYLRKYFDIY